MFTLGREWEKQHAANYIRNEAGMLVIGRVIDAAHDLLEGMTSADAVKPIFSEAFIEGASGVWEQTGSWLKKLGREHPSLLQLWRQLAVHKSAQIRFRVAAFLNEMPDDIRQQLTTSLLADPSAKVRSKTAGEISMRPTPEMLPLLRARLVLETAPQVIDALNYALSVFPESDT